MPYRICRSFEIENGHLLSKHPDKCRFPHGHSRRVEFVLESASLDANDMVCDFKVLKELMGAFLEKWDHAMAVNSADPKLPAMREACSGRVVVFEGVDPTTEIMARTLFEECRRRLADSLEPARREVRVVSVRVWETSATWAEFSEG
jgi:6-pyruvoyltetrahydropterin/6-carboxytetrahydropterin synthase